MKTPYDAAQRLRQRELDEVVSAIHNEAGALGAVEAERARVAGAMAREAELAAADLTLVSPGWQRRMQGQRQALSARRQELQTSLEKLRELAVDTFGVLRGIETAAEGFRSEVRRGEAAAEQSASDDRSATAYLRARREDGRGSDGR